MALLYKLYQDNRENSVNSGMWLARTTTIDTISTDAIAQIIERNCSMKKSDVKAVIEELIEVIKDKMQDSYAVKLDGFGTFKLSIHSTGAPSADKYNVREHVKGVSVKFRPSYTVDAGTGKHSVNFVQGVKIQETAKNAVE